MENSDLARRLKELRNKNGFSQEQLAEESQVSLRTIQRIENDESEPRGDTLKRLAKALNITPDELIDWTEQEDKGFLTFLNLSALSYLIFPLLGVVLPLALWILKKDKIKGVNELGRKIINFELTLIILHFGFFLLIVIGMSFKMDRAGDISGDMFVSDFRLMILLVGGVYLINIALIVINAFRSYHKKQVWYKPSIPFLGR